MEKGLHNRNCLARETPIDDHMNAIVYWDFVSMLALFYTAIMAPYQVGFFITADPATWGFWLDRTIDSVFILDIFLNFFRPFNGRHVRVCTGMLIVARECYTCCGDPTNPTPQSRPQTQTPGRTSSSIQRSSRTTSRSGFGSM